MGARPAGVGRGGAPVVGAPAGGMDGTPLDDAGRAVAGAAGATEGTWPDAGFAGGTAGT
ncbi:hypothetical protein EJ065_5041 [Corallococcus coralloides]|uniref:Uncharacterized protein n=2 Tax=Corallococcus coralloides TaxID=184914 RepID=A0A410RX95_CORCK|nr:hypothetical protein EJ065_5041 [Corallococcus coralloides]